MSLEERSRVSLESNIEDVTPFLYPLYDEAAGGTLQAILGSAGEIKLRSVANDPYGAEETELAGPMVDRVTIGATKDAAGEISSVRVTIGLTEEIAENTVAYGVRLATVDESGEVVRLASAMPALVAGDPFRIEWNLTAAQWEDLIAAAPSGATAQSLSIAVKKDLRARAFDAPVMAPPGWTAATQTVSMSEDLPFELSESIVALSTWITGIPSQSANQRTPFEMNALSLAMRDRGRSTSGAGLLPAGFQALPFHEPLTSAMYVRARWFDGAAAAFLEPDSLGYHDSSNLYSFAGGDPVNGRDPTGTLTIIVHGTGASEVPWWSTGGFARGLDSVVGDVWKIKTAGGKPVWRIPELTKMFADGRFAWSGANTPPAREEGARALAEYIRVVKRHFPKEPINVVSHSHGANVSTASTNSSYTVPGKIDRMVTIAKPFLNFEPTVFRAIRSDISLYDPDPRNLGGPILNIFSLEDQVQTFAATKGAYEVPPIGYRRGSAQRTTPNSRLRSAYVDIQVRTAVGPWDAHGVLHSEAMGRAIGRYLIGPAVGAAGWEAAAEKANLPTVIRTKDKGE